MVGSVVSVILYGSALYHLVAGLMAVGPTKWIKYFGQKTYSMRFPDTFNPRYELTVRALGSFALFTSSICFYAAMCSGNELKKFILINLSLLFLVRALLRVIQKDLFLSAYNITFSRSLKNILFNVILAAFTMFIGLSI